MVLKRVARLGGMVDDEEVEEEEDGGAGCALGMANECVGGRVSG